MSAASQIQKLLSRDECEKILGRSLNGSPRLLSYKITKFQDGVAGFLGDHFLLTIKYSTTTKAAFQQTYFVKALPQFNSNQMDYVSESGIFKKEVVLYRNLLSELLKISQFGPRCYFIKDNCLVLEDLRAKGYQMLPKLDYLNENCCWALLKNLAKYHASALIYEETKGVKIGEKFPEDIKEACFSFVEGQPRYKWCVSSTKCVIDLMRLLPHFEPEIGDKFHRFVFHELPLLIKPSKSFRNVLTHDDLWVNNMLFNNKLDCVFVDFQLARFAPPGFDFLVTLRLNVRQDHLEKDFDKFVSFYHSCLIEELRKHNLGDSILPRKEFEDSLNVYNIAALAEAAMYGTHVYVSEELSNHIIADINNYNEFSFEDRSKFAVKEFADDARYRERITNVLTPLVKALANS